MADLPKASYISLNTTLQEVISAHDAVREGIATHAEKERTRRHEARVALEAKTRLEGK